LQALFSDTRIAAWRPYLPAAGADVEQVLAPLLRALAEEEQAGAQGGLLLFLTIVGERLPVGDARRHTLRALAGRLRRTTQRVERAAGNAQARVGPLLVTLIGGGGRWQMRVENQGQEALRRVSIVLRPSPSIAVAPALVQVGGIEATGAVTPQTNLVIRPKNARPGGSVTLEFEVVYVSAAGPQRCESLFHIPT